MRKRREQLFVHQLPVLHEKDIELAIAFDHSKQKVLGRTKLIFELLRLVFRAP